MWIIKVLKKIKVAYCKYHLGKETKSKITKHFKELKNRRYLTKSQKKEIQNYYKSLIGRKVSLYCHEYFYSRTGMYSKKYIPTDLYSVELLSRANRLDFGQVYGDKNLTDIFLKDVRVPHTILKRMNGYYYYEGNAISEDKAIEKCNNLDDVLIKPSLLSKGEGIRSLSVKDGITNVDNKPLIDVFNMYGKDFQIQERLKQHERMNALNPTSVNTLRIVTFRSGMEILLIYSVVRIGRIGSFIDNQCAGGISAVIDDNGRLGKYGYGGYDEDNILHTGTGVVLEGYEIPSYNKAIETVKRLHYQLPFFDLIGWDIAIAEDGEPTLIEWNTKVGLSQSAFGPGFGKYTERIITELWKRTSCLWK